MSGQDLIDKGFRAGPGLGAALKQLEHQWVESRFTLDRESLLGLVAPPEAGG